MDRRLRARWDTDLKRSGLEKPNGSAFSWCGYTSQQLWAHIEAKFLPGMTRENRHLWHIDHIKPLKSAETLAEKKKLFALSNLQPMWASDNMSKGAKSMAEWQKQARSRLPSQDKTLSSRSEANRTHRLAYIEERK